MNTELLNMTGAGFTDETWVGRF